MSLAASPVAMPCRVPKWRGQFETIRCSPDKRDVQMLDLGDGNTLMIVTCALEESVVADYIKCATAVERVRGEGVFGALVPRSEVYYTQDGLPYVYSRKKAPTRAYPRHVLDIIPLLEEVIADEDLEGILPSSLGTLDITGDICYDASIPQGGSVGAHSDDEAYWPAVVIYSLGQSRFLRLVNKETKYIYNVEMPHNSIVVMYGRSFQEDFTHQVDKLAKGESVGTRLSLNIRYKPNPVSIKKARHH